MGRLLRTDEDLLVIIIFYKLLELLDVAHRLQVLLHMWQGSEVICKSRNRTQRPDCPSPGNTNTDTPGIWRLLHCPWGQDLKEGQI